MTRSSKKGPFIDFKLFNRVENIKNKNLKKNIKTWSRSSTVIPSMVGLLIEIHNGKKHIPVNINSDMVGHKLGEFVVTRNFKTWGKKIKRNK